MSPAILHSRVNLQSPQLPASGTNTECQGHACVFTCLSSSNLSDQFLIALYSGAMGKNTFPPVVQKSVRLNLCHLCIIVNFISNYLEKQYSVSTQKDGKSVNFPYITNENCLRTSIDRPFSSC